MSNLRESFAQEQWITRRSENLLWLPPEYRPRSTAVYGNVVALGQDSGRLSVLEFAFRYLGVLLYARHCDVLCANERHRDCIGI